jgi:hypothetical protein
MTYRRVDDHARLVDKGIRSVKEETPDACFCSLDDACSSLAASLSAGSLSIVVGAGLSKPCGIPDWPTLVQTLFVSYLSDNYTPPTTDLLRYLPPNPVVQIRILRRLYELKPIFDTAI